MFPILKYKWGKCVSFLLWTLQEEYFRSLNDQYKSHPVASAEGQGCNEELKGTRDYRDLYVVLYQQKAFTHLFSLVLQLQAQWLYGDM